MWRQQRLIFVVLFVTALFGCDDGDHAASPASRAWSKAELIRYAIGKTKAEIRDEFGKPSSVTNQGNTWMYTEVGSLRVYDPDAQIRIAAWVKFDTTTQAVETVQYP